MLQTKLVRFLSRSQKCSHAKLETKFLGIDETSITESDVRREFNAADPNNTDRAWSKGKRVHVNLKRSCCVGEGLAWFGLKQ